MKVYGKLPRVRVAPKPRRTCDGIVFHSRGEMLRWQELRLLEKAGVLRRLERQVPFQLWVNGQLIGEYVADFVYSEAGGRIVEDAKGFRTEVYRLKKKLMAACYGIEIRETSVWKKGVGTCSTSHVRLVKGARSGRATSSSSTSTDSTGD